jgi:hypothetical protein
VTFQPSAPHKRSRWLALLAIVMLASSLLVTSAMAAPSFTFTPDDQGQNDEPGQKDLTAQSSAVDSSAPNHFFTAWKWDDISWSGNNTGDGCSLFDTDAVKNGLVDYAICGTVTGKGPVTLLSVTVYSCSDKRVDRCTNPVLRFTATGATASTYCTVTDQATGTFPVASPDKDTLIVCDITALAAASTPAISDLTGGTLINTCSYPSKEPNSDPSDCVITPTAANTSVTTLSSGTTTWSATLNDTSTLNPTSATGGVVFKLWSDNLCTALVWTSPSVPVTASGTATTNGGGTPNNGNTVSTAGTYYWTSDYTPTGLFNASSSPCGEATVVTAPSVSGSAG